MFKTKEKIEKWLMDNNISYYTINDDLTVDVTVDVDLSNKSLHEIPIQFGIIDGNFWCNNNYLESLKGCPIEVRGDFYCSNNRISNFKDCPKIVEGNLNCAHNFLISINDLESKVYGNFLHSCYNGGYKIKELNPYYKDSQHITNNIVLSIPGKELENVVCERYLQEKLPMNNITTITRKNKI